MTSPSNSNKRLPPAKLKARQASTLKLSSIGGLASTRPPRFKAFLLDLLSGKATAANLASLEALVTYNGVIPVNFSNTSATLWIFKDPSTTSFLSLLFLISTTKDLLRMLPPPDGREFTASNIPSRNCLQEALGPVGASLASMTSCSSSSSSSSSSASSSSSVSSSFRASSAEMCVKPTPMISPAPSEMPAISSPSSSSPSLPENDRDLTEAVDDACFPAFFSGARN
mmetsp:Transcript_40024/g.113491  ORF Transcript_40024/g.113491 Transcript_40024/m.113491 type:complete len:227 (-) Transcript_40024:319-999(-)